MLNWWRRLAQNRLLDAGMALVTLLCVFRLVTRLPARAVQNDFANYYTLGHMIVEGRSPYGKPLEPEYQRHGFVYEDDVRVATQPPTLIWLFSPLARLSPRTAFWTWMTLQAVCLAVILWLIRLALGDRFSPRGWWFVYLVTISSATVYWHFFYSQWQLLLTAMIFGAYVLQQRGHKTWSCVMAVVAVAIKLYPAVLLPWFLWRSSDGWSGRIKNGLIVTGILGGAVLLSGIGYWQEFFSTSFGLLAEHVINRTSIFTVPSFITNLGYAGYNFQPPAEPARLWWLIGEIVGGALIAGAYIVSLRASKDEEAQFCLLCTMMIAGVFKTEAHYLIFLIFPMAVMATRLGNPIPGWSVIGFTLVLLALNDLDSRATPFLDRHLILKTVVNYIPLYGMLTVAWFFARAIVCQGDAIDTLEIEDSRRGS